MIGSSIIVHAEEAAIREGRPNLGLEAKITWEGVSGMKLQGLQQQLQTLMLRNRHDPTIIVMHLGGNNIAVEKIAKVMRRVEQNVKHIQRLCPEAMLVWSDILPRSSWRGKREEANKSMNQNRRRINRHGRQMVKHYCPKGRAISYKTITTGVLYDGVHLTRPGNKIFLDIIQKALEMFLSGNETIHYE